MLLMCPVLRFAWLWAMVSDTDLEARWCVWQAPVGYTPPLPSKSPPFPPPPFLGHICATKPRGLPCMISAPSVTILPHSMPD